MKVVIFNGPPRSGKDAVSRMLVEHIEAQGVDIPILEESLSLPLRHIAYSMVGQTYHESTYETFKETPFAEFGRTGRQLMIDASESFLKPTYGIEVMAKMLIERVKDFNGLLLIRDGGFQIEVDPICEAYGPQNVYIVNCYRNGCSFDGDSREYITHQHSRYRMQFWNQGSLDDLRTEAGRIYGRLVNQIHWVL